MEIRVQEAAFDAGDELNAFTKRQVNAGAVVSFSGIVRDVTGVLKHIEIECYPAMTDQALAEFAKEAKDRWELSDVLIIHRHGRLEVAEQIMMVATAAKHRIAAFEAAQFLMDYLKSRAPFWKKEITREGENWVLSNDADENALSRW